ncbi:MAG: hypothetical protein WC364_01645 [Eubacteriales bacterium]|jgi:hypothetical protein
MKNKRQKLTLKMCMLEKNKLCDNCCECFICCLDSKKVCDNCGLCLEAPDYGIFLTGTSLFTEEAKK